jgi:hypothetical protein
MDNQMLIIAQQAIKTFDNEYERYERLLKRLFQEEHPHNTDIYDVFPKVAVLNVIYSTRIIAVSQVAEHILKQEIDCLLADGSLEAVRRIANVKIREKKYCFYSFATKYCNWHNPDAYPIFDKNACACLLDYKRKDCFAGFKLDDLWVYQTFKKVVDDFRTHYRLESLNYKELDKFLWQCGGEVIKSKADAKAVGTAV